MTFEVGNAQAIFELMSEKRRMPFRVLFVLDIEKYWSLAKRSGFQPEEA